MNLKPFEFFSVLGGIFSTLAAVAAYLITYGEYSKHFPTKGQPRKIALNAALTAFIFFFIMTLGAGFLLMSRLFQ